MCVEDQGSLKLKGESLSESLAGRGAVELL